MITLDGLTVIIPENASPVKRILGALFPRWSRYAPAMRTVLSGITLQVRAGEGWRALGDAENGTTALYQVLAGQTLHTSGQLSIAAPNAYVSGAGEQLLPDFSGQENARLILRLKGLHPAEIKQLLPEIMAFAGLTSKAFLNPVSSYSTAERAALAIAAALYSRSKILLFSRCLELCTIAVQEACVVKIEELLQSGGCLVLETQSDALAMRLCGRRFALAQGRLASAGANLTALPRRRAEKPVLSQWKAAFSAPLTPAPNEASAALKQVRQQVERLNRQLTAYANANDEFADEVRRLEMALYLEEQRSQQLSGLLNRLLKSFSQTLALLHEQFSILSRKSKKPPRP